MNIAFIHRNGIIPEHGGISRVTNMLCSLFEEYGYHVVYIAVDNLHKEHQYLRNQYFLDSTDLSSEIARNSFVKIIRNNEIDIIINQAAFNIKIVSFVKDNQKELGYKIITCYHNSILTPIYNYAYQKEYSLKKKNLGFIFHVLRNHRMVNLLVNGYIARYRRVYQKVLNCSDKVIVLCDGQKTELLKMLGTSANDKILVIPNYIKANDNLPIQKSNIITWVGTFDCCVKRPDYMIRIWRLIEEKYPEYRLYMLGDGASFEEMKLLARQLKLNNLVFTGRVSPEYYYEKSIITCVTSTHEAFSMVIIEALQHQSVPVVFNSFASANFLIESGKNGKLVEPFDIVSFAKVIGELLDDKEKLKRIRNNSLKSLCAISPEVVYCQWEKLFNALSVRC